MAMLIYSEGFSFAQVDNGWRWQETGAEGWSDIYDTMEDAIKAVREEFARLEEVS